MKKNLNTLFTRTGITFVLLALITLLTSPFLGKVFCEMDTEGACGLYSGLSLLPLVVGIFTTLGLIGIIGIIVGVILRKFNKNKL